MATNTQSSTSQGPAEFLARYGTSSAGAVLHSPQRGATPIAATYPQRFGRNPGGPSLPATATRYANLVAVTSVSGGIGSSTLAAMLAAELDRRDYTCAMVDADFDGGGIDVLLGLEEESGLRFETVEAPLGRIDGAALVHEMPHWGRIGVLAFDAWNGSAPDSWQTEAVIRALCEAHRVVVADMGRGASVGRTPDVVGGVTVAVVELSVLGLARAKAWLAGRPLPDGLLLAGAQPRGAGGRTAVGQSEAEAFLGRSVEACLCYDRRLHDDMLAGLGIRVMMRRNRRAVKHLADRIETLMTNGHGDD